MQTKYNLNEPTNFQIFDNFSTLFSLGCSWNIRSFQFNKEKHFMSSGRNYSSLFLPASVPNQGDKCLRRRRFWDINLSQTIKLLFLWFGLRWKRRETGRERIALLFCGHYRRVLGLGASIYEVHMVGVGRLSKNNWEFSDRNLTHLWLFSDTFLYLTVFWQNSDRYMTDFQKFGDQH